MRSQTATRRLADVLLADGLDEFVTTRRAAGVSWRLICRDLLESTDGSVDVTEVTLRSWFPELTAAAS